MTIAQDLNNVHYDLKMRREQAEEYRRDLERHADPNFIYSQAAETACVNMGLSLVRTGILLNGGALVSLPAVFTLFSLDAHAISRSVTLTACLFAMELVCSWLAAFAGFFALKN